MNPGVVSPAVQRAVGFGAGAATLRTGSILLSKQIPAMTKIHPALGIAGIFTCQLLTVTAISSGAMATYYTTQAVVRHYEKKEKE